MPLSNLWYSPKSFPISQKYHKYNHFAINCNNGDIIFLLVFTDWEYF